MRDTQARGMREPYLAVGQSGERCPGPLEARHCPVGTVLGALMVGSIETAIVAAGLTGYFTQCFNGIIIVLSLVTYRLTSPRTRAGRR